MNCWTEEPQSSLAKFRTWLQPTRLRVIVLLTLAFAVWGWFDVRIRGTVDPQDVGIHKTDFTVYTEAGAAFFDGRDPYVVANPRGWKYLYPPLFAILVAPLHSLPPQAQVSVWFICSVLMGWGCYRECVRIGKTVLPGASERGAFGPIPSWIGYAAVTAAMLPALNCLQRGQVGVAKLFLLLVGFRLLVESRSAVRSFVAGTVLALPIVLKITPLLPVMFIVFQQFVTAYYDHQRQSALKRAGSCSTGIVFGLVLCLLIVPAGIVGWRANLHHLNTWWHCVAVKADASLSDDFAGDSYSVRNQSFTNAVHRMGNWANFCFAGGDDDQGPAQLSEGGAGLLMDAPRVDTVLFAARIAAGCLLLAVGFALGRRQDPLSHAVGFGLACVSTLVLVPIARGHYYVMFLPAVMFLCPWLIQQHRPKLAVTYAIVPGLLTIAHYALMDFTGRVGLLGIGTTLWYAAVGITILRLCQQQQPDAAAIANYDGGQRALSGTLAELKKTA